MFQDQVTGNHANSCMIQWLSAAGKRSFNTGSSYNPVNFPVPERAKTGKEREREAGGFLLLYQFIPPSQIHLLIPYLGQHLQGYVLPCQTVWSLAFSRPLPVHHSGLDSLSCLRKQQLQEEAKPEKSNLYSALFILCTEDNNSETCTKVFKGKRSFVPEVESKQEGLIMNDS